MIDEMVDGDDDDQAMRDSGTDVRWDDRMMMKMMKPTERRSEQMTMTRW